MSGLSLAVGPQSNHDAATAAPPSSDPTSKGQDPAVMGGAMGGSLRVIELQLVAFIMVFSASGLVPLLDLVFPAFATVYMLALSRLAFPSSGSGSNDGGGREVFEGSRLFRAYVVVGTTVGLFLPLAYVLGGFARRDDHAVRSATPHLFLLSCQILTENITNRMGVFSPPVRAIVPLLYTVRRVFLLADWIYDVWFNESFPDKPSINEVAWMWFGRSLAVANLLYFSTNLFAFLIPRFLPRAFEKYFKERGEICAKTAEDKRARAAMEQPTEKGKDTESKKDD